MPRSNRSRRAPEPGGRARGRRRGPTVAPADDGATGSLEAALAGMQRVETHPDGEWVVRQVPGPAARKTYRCPGCDQEVTPGTPHVVVWSALPAVGAFGDVGDRRHWHTPCWRSRARRPGR